VVKTLVIPFLAKTKAKAHVIHAHTALLQVLFPVYLMSLLGKTPFIITVHGDDIRKLRRMRIVKLIQRFLLKKASYITCVSKEIQQILSGEYGLENDKLITIPNGYDDNLVSKVKAHNINGKENKIVFVGRLEQGKDPFTLIRAFKRISIRHEDAKLLIIGDGSLRESMETLCKELNIADRVFFYGHLSLEKVMALVADSNIYALTSLEEGLPISLIEAMALGRPIVATNVGGVPDVVEDGINGLLVPPRAPERLAQAMERLLNEPGLSLKLAKAASTSAKDYSWHNIVSMYEHLYETLIVQS
jgi:glycosyltransferase involved in cell wall biosynthesis